MASETQPEWTRPESVPSPSVWGIYEGRKPVANGKLPRFRIQDCSEEWVEPTVKHMVTHFLRDEPLCSHMGIDKHVPAYEEMSDLWRHALSYKIGLVAILDNPEELDDPSLPLLAGCNVTFPTFPNAKDPVLKNPELQSILNIVNVISHSVDCFIKYNASSSMYAFGLSVDPVYRGQSLGEFILKARYPLCRAVGIPLTVTVFTGPASQASARKAGLEVVTELDPQEYEENGEKVFAGCRTTNIKLMAARIPPE